MLVSKVQLHADATLVKQNRVFHALGWFHVGAEWDPDDEVGLTILLTKSSHDASPPDLDGKQVEYLRSLAAVEDVILEEKED